MSRRVGIILLGLGALVADASFAEADDCMPYWTTTIGNPGVSGTLIPAVNALAIYDDGTGPALHAGGSFTFAGGNSANYIARWNGLRGKRETYRMRDFVPRGGAGRAHRLHVR